MTTSSLFYRPQHQPANGENPYYTGQSPVDRFNGPMHLANEIRHGDYRDHIREDKQKARKDGQSGA